jgi:hypothetical protein
MSEADCMGLTEINRNWYKIDAQDFYSERIKYWWDKSITKTTWLKDREWPSQFQRGGCGITAQGSLADYVQDTGEDEEGLGRWCWLTVEGADTASTCIIQLYRPVRNEKGFESVFRQQAAITEDDPLIKFDKELMELIDIQQEQHQVIIMGDFNEDMSKDSDLKANLEDRGLYNPLESRYGTQPNTHSRGSVPIDGIWIPMGMDLIRGGFDEGCDSLSDHREIWVDLDISQVLGHNRGEFKSPKTRKLQGSNEKSVKKFNQLFNKQMSKSKLLTRALGLREKIIKNKNIITKEDKEEYEKLDNERSAITAYAEKNCRRLKDRKVPFSPDLQKAIGKIEIWKSMERIGKTTKKINTRKIIEAKKRWNIEEFIPVPTTLDEIQDKLQEARVQYRSIKKAAPELRKDFLDLLIKQAEKDGQGKKAKELRLIKEMERDREVHRRIKRARGVARKSGVKFVERDETDGTRSTITDKYEMELEIIKHNKANLLQANDTPLRSGSLAEILTGGDILTWERFIQGEINLPDEGLDVGTRKWLEKMQSFDYQSNEVEITIEEYTKSWKKIRESTGCAPGPLHVGVFKATAENKFATALNFALAMIPISTGYSPKRWANCVDAMIPKKKNDWRPAKLRLISLLMPDFNHNNKILGRIAMKHAEKKGLIANEQYGSRKGLSACKHALNKRLLLDILRIQKRPGVLCANDATACYDRILPFSAYISMRRMGLSQQAVQSMLEPIMAMTHKVRTAYGDSTESYGGHDWENEPHGICQGNGAGPAIWVAVSSPLLDILREAGYGARLHAAMGKTFLHLAGFAFVDDTDTLQTGDLNEDISEVLLKAQAGLQLWEEGIRATGGELKGSKSDFAIINFIWEKGYWRYEKRNDTYRLSVSNDKGQVEELKQLDASEARRTLGVWQAVDGNEKKQQKVMLEKADEWTASVMKSSLTKRDVITGAKTSLYPALTYGLMATNLSKKQCNQVFYPIRKRLLPKMGICRKIPAVVVHGPKKYGGLEIKDLYSIQGIEHIKALLDHAGKESSTGKLIEILISGHVLELGQEGFLFHQDYGTAETLLTDSWIKHTMEFIHNNDIEIEGEHSQLHRWRVHDSMIMDDGRKRGKKLWYPQEWTAINKCRLYLQATTKSDLSTGDGKRILTSAWECSRDWTSTSAKAYSWPVQPRPSEKQRNIWKKFLTDTYAITSQLRRWHQDLGDWYHQALEHISWRFHQPTQSLYKQHMGNKWQRWRKDISRSRSQKYRLTTDVEDSIPAGSVPALVTTSATETAVYFEGCHGPHIAHQISRAQVDVPSTGTTEPSIIQGLAKVHESLHWAVEATQMPEDNGSEIAQQIQLGTAKLICDGSLKGPIGTAAAASFSAKKENNFIMRNQTPGRRTDMNSYRCELTGILACVITTNVICDTHAIEEGTITLGCDNEAALWEAFGDEEINVSQPSYDILQVIRNQLSISKIKWKSKHVKGHQDEIKEAELDEWALANIDMDTKAKEYCKAIIEAGTGPTIANRMVGEGWRVLINGINIASKLGASIYDHIYKEDCIKYWEKKERLQYTPRDDTDWVAYKRAIQRMPRSKQIWTTKHFSGWEGTGKMMKRWEERETDECPRCLQPENHRHIVQCQSAEAKKEFGIITQDLRHWLRRTTSAAMRAAILEQIEAYQEDRFGIINYLWDRDVISAMSRQSMMGKRAFAEGFLSIKWRKQQEEWFKTTQSRKSAEVWTACLIEKILTVSWDMWEARNGLIHGATEEHQNIIIRELDGRLERILNEGKKNRFLPPLDANFFKHQISYMKAKTERTKRIWLKLATRILDKDKRRLIRNSEAAVMRNWLNAGAAEGNEEKQE